MSKIELNPVATVIGINANFQKIEDELNNKVFYRNNPVGEPNTIQNDVDVNGKNLFNINQGYFGQLFIDGEDIEPGLEAALNAPEIAAQAAASANQAAISAVEAAHFAATAGAVSGSGSFLQAGVGAVPRSNQDKGRELVTLEDFGGIGDWNGTTGTDNVSAFNKALTASDVVRISKGGRFRMSSSVVVPSGKTIISDGGEIVFTSGGLQLNSNITLIRTFISGNNRTNGTSGISLLAGGSNCKLDSVKIRDTFSNGIDNSNASTNLIIINPDIADTGGAGSNPAFQGCSIYSAGAGLRVQGGVLRRPTGQGAIFLNGGSNVVISGVDISDTFFRGINVFNNPTKVTLTCNTIRNTGSINTSGSGVGCNGIFIVANNWYDVVVSYNDIQDVAENGIEGSGTFYCNTISRTGAFSLTTPSKEGIFLSKSTVCFGNKITDAFGAGIKSFNQSTGATAIVKANTIISPLSAGISLQADSVSGTYSRLSVDSNIVFGENDSGQGGYNIITSNSGAYTAATCSVTNNLVVGRASNSISQTIGTVRNNSFDPISGYVVDVSATAPKSTRYTMIFNAPITNNRAAFANPTNPSNGDVFVVIRTANATGAFSVNVAAPTTIKALSTISQKAELTYDGSNWVLTDFANL